MSNDGTMTTTELLFALLRCEISGSAEPIEEKALSEGALSEIYAISNTHDVAHIISSALENKGVLAKDEISQKLLNTKFLAIYRSQQLKYALKEICSVFEKEKIRFIPLKGSVLKSYYPQEWMRTSCDIDILVHEVDLKAAAAVLEGELGYCVKTHTTHDISLYSPADIHLELHFNLLEVGRANSAGDILKNVWDYAKLKDGSDYHCELLDEMFYFYHIAHMAKHFENGGCGIRPFIDLWLLDNRSGVDAAKRNELLLKGDLLKFADAARKLCRVWLQGEAADEISVKMEKYVLSGGLYGTNENRVVVQQQKKGGKWGYVISRMFLPYETLKYHYPVLQKHRWLTPVMEVWRWFKLAFCGHSKRVMSELRYNQSISSEKAAEVKDFLLSIGL